MLYIVNVPISEFVADEYAAENLEELLDDMQNAGLTDEDFDTYIEEVFELLPTDIELNDMLCDELDAVRAGLGIDSGLYHSSRGRYTNVTETTISGIETKHSLAGYIIISADRSERNSMINRQNNRNLKYDISASGYSYTPVWGGYDEELVGGEKEMKKGEPSFIVFNIKRGTSKPENDMSELYEYGVKWCKDYRQDSFLYKLAGDNTLAQWVNRWREIIGRFNNIHTPKQAADEYFTCLNKGSRNIDNPKRAFSFVPGADAAFKEGVHHPRLPRRR